MKVLLDASVVRHAVRRFPTTVERSVEWGGQTHTYKADVMSPRAQQSPWLEEQIRALEPIAEAARAGRIQLHLGGELRIEAMHRPFGALAWGPESIFHDIPLGTIPPPFAYARLVVSYSDRPGAAYRRWERFLDSTGDADFVALKAALGGNKNADALHVLTAERAGLDVFLTTDRKLANSLRTQRKVQLRTRVLVPLELLELLDREA